MHCKLCGLPNPKSPLRDAGHEFCCHGCREVFRCFGETVLVADAPVAPTPPPSGAWVWTPAGLFATSSQSSTHTISGLTRRPRP